MVVADLIPAEQVALDQATEAPGLPNAGERASEAVSGVRELSPGLPRVPFEDSVAYGGTAAAPWTRRRRAGRLPAGINRARGAGWERPRP